MKRFIAIISVVLLLCLPLCGCFDNEAEKVSYNLSKEADNFNITRRLTVINARTDKPLFELIGAFSLSNNYHGELEITVQTGPKEFKKHFIYINEEWTMYVVEDISGAQVSPYHYEINFLPEMIIPFTFTSND